MGMRLSKEEVVTIRVLAEKGQNHCEIARTLGVTEGAVRYQLRRQAEGAEDGRKDRPFKAESMEAVITAWFAERADDERPVNVQDLWEHLVDEHGYTEGYRTVLRFVRAKYPKPKMRTYRRVETPPGAQSQTDWGEFPAVDVGRGPEPLHAFVMVLSHCRKPAVIWSRREHQLAWLWCHNEAFRRLAGVAAVNRIDNVRTAIAAGAGPWGSIHPVYRAYSRSVGFHVDACNVRDARAKGKVESKVRLSRLRLDPTRRPSDSLEELQARTDERIERWARKTLCPATGLTVQESWERELERLAPLPILPEPFDVAVTRPVQRDCLVQFEGRAYTVPFELVGRQVEVRGCTETVQILADGCVVREYPRQTSERILIDPTCYEGEATADLLPPRPLGRMGQKLQEIVEMPVEQRPLDLYAALSEVAR